jgi:DNA-binding transcriptional LysR family regulator
VENFRLRVFRTVAHHLSFSRAAEDLLLTQPAVTQQIKALEDEYGVPLFDRSGGRITLTPAGRALLPYAEKLKAISDEAAAALGAAVGEQSGPLTLGASRTIAQYVLPGIMAAFLRLHPRVRISTLSDNTDEVLDAVVSRKADLALIEGPPMRKDVRVEPFMRDEMLLAVPASHEWANREITAAELAQAPLLMRERGSGSRRVLESALTKIGLKPKQLNVAFEFDSNEGLLSGVEAGLGVTFVSRWTVRNQLALGVLRPARVRGMELDRMFSLASPAGPEPSGNAGAFRRFLLEQAAVLPARAPSRRSRKDNVR